MDPMRRHPHSPAFLLLLALSFFTLSAGAPNPNPDPAPNPDPDDSIRFVLAAIPASYSLPPPPSPDPWPSTLVAHRAQCTFEGRRAEDLWDVSRGLCDTYFGKYQYRELADKLLPQAFNEGLEQQRWREQIQDILNPIRRELDHAELSSALKIYLASMAKIGRKAEGARKSSDEANLEYTNMDDEADELGDKNSDDAKMGDEDTDDELELGDKNTDDDDVARGADKMCTFLLYDRIYAVLQSRLEGALKAKGHEEDEDDEEMEEDEEGTMSDGVFALEWLKQMRTMISIRYEAALASLRELLYGKYSSRNGKIRVDKIVEEREKKERENGENGESARDGEEWRKEAEKIKQYGKVMVERANKLGGVGTPLHRVVREQIKLSLMNDPHKFLTKLWNPEEYANCGYVLVSISNVLSEYLLQMGIEDDVDDPRVFLCSWLSCYGSRVEQFLVEMANDPQESAYGHTLQHTLDKIRPKLEVEMGLAWEYGRMVAHFGDKFAESKKQIDKIGAFAVYHNLYKSLAEQLAAGEKDYPVISTYTTARYIMSPEEYTAYWLATMSKMLGQKMAKKKAKLAKLLEEDRIVMVEMREEKEERARKRAKMEGPGSETGKPNPEKKKLEMGKRDIGKLIELNQKLIKVMEHQGIE